MRQSRALSALLSLLLLLTGLLLAGCGGNGNKPVAINVTPSPASIAFGQTVQLNASAVNSGNAAVQGATFTYTSDKQLDPVSPVQVSPNGGNVCGGEWDANFINCCSGGWDATGTLCTARASNALHRAQVATITVTSGSITQTVQVFMHVGVDSLQFVSSPGVPAIPPTCTAASCTSPSCTSVGQTSTAFLAEAKSSNNTYCINPPTSTNAPCTIPSPELLGNSGLAVSPFQWTSDDATVASTTDVVTGATSPTVLATGPGKANIIVSTANGNSGSVTASFPFYTCPITSISVTDSSNPQSFTPGSTQTLTATLVDSNNVTIPYPQSKPVTVPFPNLNWISTNPYMASVAVQTNSATEPASNGVTLTKSVPTNQATATGAIAGSGALVASCTPPNCNKNLFPVYSAPLAASISGGTATSGLWIASTQSLNITSIAAGGSFAAGATANSFMMNQQGTFGLIGTSTGTLVLNALTGGLSLIQFVAIPQPSVLSVVVPPPTIPPILKISPDGVFGAVAGRPVGKTGNWIGGINLTTNQLFTFPVVGTVTGGDFTPDSQFLWVTTTDTTGNRLYTYQISGATSGASSMSLPNAAPKAALDVAFLANGPVGYVTGAASNNSVTGYATCFAPSPATPLTHTVVDTQGTAPNAATNVRALPDGSGIAVFNSPNLDIITTPAPHTLQGTSACPGSGTLIGNFSNNPVTGAPTASDLNQFLITPDGTKAVFTSKSSGTVVIFPLPNGTPIPVTLLNSATLANNSDPTKNSGFKGAIAADSQLFFVGANDGNVHEIDLTGSTTACAGTPCDVPGFAVTSAALVSANLTQADGVTAASPDFVVIRNQ